MEIFNTKVLYYISEIISLYVYKFSNIVDFCVLKKSKQPDVLKFKIYVLELLAPSVCQFVLF